MRFALWTVDGVLLTPDNKMRRNWISDSAFTGTIARSWKQENATITCQWETYGKVMVQYKDNHFSDNKITYSGTGRRKWLRLPKHSWHFILTVDFRMKRNSIFKHNGHLEF